jgi:hypothetical protein
MSCGIKRSLETPQALSAPRRLQDLPAESKFPQRKSTVYNPKTTIFKKTVFYKIHSHNFPLLLIIIR